MYVVKTDIYMESKTYLETTDIPLFLENTDIPMFLIFSTLLEYTVKQDTKELHSIENNA